jgi:transcriptional regulator with XRE-family HTH domain
LEIIGNNLRLLRDALGWTQAEVSEKTGVSREYISKIEAGLRSNVSQNVIRLLTVGLDTTQEWLTQSTGWSYNPPTVKEAFFFHGIQRRIFKPDQIFSVEYSDEHRKKKTGFVFVSARGILAVAGWRALMDYWPPLEPILEGGKEATVKVVIMQILKEKGFDVVRVVLSDTESKNLPHIDWVDFVQRNKQAKVGEPKTKNVLPVPLSISEVALIDKVRKTKTDIKVLLEYIDTNNKIR